MGLFSKATEEKIKKAGGRIEGNGGHNIDEVEAAAELVRSFNTNENLRGFYFVMEKKKKKLGSTQVEGMVRIKDVSKMDIVEVVARSLQFTNEELLQLLIAFKTKGKV